ncbi:penicillin-binding protein 1A [Desulfoluna spongiiphila]|uniref:Penicillin-binding protein 1A n=1 Tax=Desulfoluna spongiiphila TaxID=419481 RepID=A0A1G5BUV9_9BACT|nr:PBP1A family penicillin-binding protein [Desulfoluna spongiiphila]SCX93992.1 penicillin-binding protein 1A [Desulfoluna spongiiphila]
MNRRFVLTVIAVLVIGTAAGLMAGLFFGTTRDLPQIEALKSFKPSSVSRVYSEDGALLAEFYAEKRDPVPLAIVPTHLQNAIINTEDRNFYDHNGVDLKGIARAIVKDILARNFVEGASTITQQLAKTLFLTREKSIDRKLKEAILAFQLERRYTKKEILELYLNQIYFGSGAYGVESAANIYFGKGVSELTLAECALLAGLPKSPSRYSPLVSPEKAIRRRNLVLKLLHDRHRITTPAYKAALAEPLALTGKRGRVHQAPYFVDYLKDELAGIVGLDRLYQDGLTIRTTLNLSLQKAGEASMAKNMARLEARMKRHRIKNPAPQCAFFAVDVNTGGILAMAGGRNFKKSPFNRATQAKRQPGSSFKPFIYGLAVEQGIDQNRLILDSPVSFSMGRGKKPWQPKNFSRKYSGEVTLRKALALSKNIPAVRLADSLGVANVAAFARRLGITSQLSNNLSLALGTSETTLMELTRAYAVFPNQGVKSDPMAITRIENRDGRVIWEGRPSHAVALSREDAAVITDMLAAVVTEGTGKGALRVGKPLAGKTGTTDNYRDALFLGFSPYVAAGVWVGNDNYTPLGRVETGARAALPIWTDLMDTAWKNRPTARFDHPDGVTLRHMDPDTGRIASEPAKGSVPALFKTH